MHRKCFKPSLLSDPVVLSPGCPLSFGYKDVYPDVVIIMNSWKQSYKAQGPGTGWEEETNNQSLSQSTDHRMKIKVETLGQCKFHRAQIS